MAKHDYFSEENLRKDLKGKTARGGMATAGEKLISIIFMLASMSILNRLNSQRLA